MREKSNPVGAALSFGWSGLAVGLMLLGRWTPERLFTDAALSSVFWIVKIAALMALLLLVALPKVMAADRRAPFIGLFTVLMGYVFASYFWNPSPLPYANLKLADLAYNFVLVSLLAAGLCRKPLRDAFWVMLVAALGVMALIGLITLPTAIASSEQGRLSVLGGGPNVFGRNMAVLALACLYFGLNHARFRIICAGLASAALICLIGSGSRGSLVALLAGTAVLFLLDPVCRRFVLSRPLVALAFLAGGGLVLLVSDVGIVAEIGQERIVAQALQGGSLSFRDILFRYAWDFWLQAPAFGNGLGSFVRLGILDIEYPHNILLEFLCETGVFGLILFLVFLVVSGTRHFVGANPERGLILALIAVFAVAAQASGDFVDARFLFLFLLYPLVGSAAVRARISVKPSRFQSHTGRQ